MMNATNNDLPTTDVANAAPILDEIRVRGEALGGAEQKSSVDHAEYEKTRETDLELRLDGEDDNLYNDGLDIGDDTEPYAGTDGDSIQGMKG